MKKYKNGVYYCPKNDSIYLLTNIMHDWEYLKDKFVILDFESSAGTTKAIWVYNWSFKNVIYLGKF